MFCSDLEQRTARKDHCCTSCGELIPKGSKYVFWTSVEDSWFNNKMHPECFAAHQEEAGGYSWEYMPYSHDRPEVV